MIFGKRFCRHARGIGHMVPGAARGGNPGSSSSQVFDVSVCAQARVVCKIPAGVVRVLVDHDLIASPVPAHDDVVIVRGDVPVEIIEPEAFPVSARQHEYMLRSKATGEASVRPRLILVVMGIVGATVMSHPLIVTGVNVGKFRMTFLVRANAVLGHSGGLLPSGGRGRARLLGRRRGNGAVRGNVSATDRRGATAAACLPTASLILRKTCQANENR